MSTWSFTLCIYTLYLDMEDTPVPAAEVLIDLKGERVQQIKIIVFAVCHMSPGMVPVSHFMCGNHSLL